MISDGIAPTAKAAQVASTATGRSGLSATQPAAGAAPAAATSEAPKVDLSSLHEQLATINRMLQEQRSNLAFSVDEGTGKTVVRVVRQSTGEVIRQIPSEEALAIASSLRQGGTLSSLGIETWS